MRTSGQDRPDIVQARRRWRRLQGGFDPNRLVFLDEAAAKTNMISSVRLDGTCAAMTIEAATATDVLTAYVEHILAPSLHPGDIVVMDNLAPHKSPRARALIEAAGAEVLFLPPYSPDLNPIEKMWSKIKALVRGARARTREALLDAIAQVTPNDARGWFVSCGYSFI